jgi:hypothetical protein
LSTQLTTADVVEHLLDFARAHDTSGRGLTHSLVMAARVRPFHIGVHLDGEPSLRPLLGVAASKDGGVMFWPKPIGDQTWLYGIVDVPSGRFAGQSWARPGDAAAASSRPPKIHYHRSGWVSANLAGVGKRRSFKGLPMRLLTGAQIFTATFHDPQRMPPYRPKVNDVFVVAHGEWPPAVHVQGFLFDRTRLRPALVSQLSLDRPVSLVQNDRDEIVIDLAWHGADIVLVLRIDTDDSWPGASGSPRCALAAFDTKLTDVDATAPAIAIWNPGPWPNVFELTAPENRPFARWGLPQAPVLRRRRNMSSGPNHECRS